MIPEQWLENLSNGERIAQDLRLKIVSNAFAPNEKLSENQLASMYEVSRSPIRDAIKILANENLIIPERMGVVVKGITDKDIKEIYDIRLMIERFVFERLCNEDKSDLLIQLKKTIEMMKIAVKFKDAKDFSYYDIQFHQIFIQSIHHNQLFYLWQQIRPLMQMLVLIDMTKRMNDAYDDFNRVIENHELYLDAIEKGDKALFKQAMHLNFDDVDDSVHHLF